MEVIMKPLLCVPKEVGGTFSAVLGVYPSSMLVAASTCGLKSLVYTIPVCTMCRSKGSFTLHIPTRTIRALIRDCVDRGIRCIAKLNDVDKVCFPTPVPRRLVNDCTELFGKLRTHKIDSVYRPYFRKESSSYVTGVGYRLYPS